MGIFCSSESKNLSTAKLVLQDGRLQEFSYPVKVSYVLQNNPTCFICNSDDMEFNDVVSVIEDEEELQLGQLYFALPLDRLKHPLKAEEMAALAVKATSSLMESRDRKCWYRRKLTSPMLFSGEDYRTYRRVDSSNGGHYVELSRNRRSRGKRKFNAMLNTITE